MEMPPSAKRGGASRRMAAAMTAMLSPSSVEATVTGPWGHRATVWEANISAVQARPGIRTVGVISGPYHETAGGSARGRKAACRTAQQALPWRWRCSQRRWSRSYSRCSRSRRARVSSSEVVTASKPAPTTAPVALAVPPTTAAVPPTTAPTTRPWSSRAAPSRTGSAAARRGRRSVIGGVSREMWRLQPNGEQGLTVAGSGRALREQFAPLSRDGQRGSVRAPGGRLVHRPAQAQVQHPELEEGPALGRGFGGGGGQDVDPQIDGGHGRERGGGGPGRGIEGVQQIAEPDLVQRSAIGHPHPGAFDHRLARIAAQDVGAAVEPVFER